MVVAVARPYPSCVTTAHLHLLVNHTALFASVFAFPLLVWSWWRPNRGAWGSAVFLLTLGAGGAGVSQWSGEGAEEAVEDLPGVREAAIAEHEERAEVALVTTLVAAGVGALGFLVGGARTRVATGLTALGAAASFGTMAWTASAGGLIRHAEEIGAADARLASEEGTRFSERSPAGSVQEEGRDDDDGNASRK